MLNQKLQLKLSQKLSPQQIQLMKLIQLSTLEFEEKLKNEIEENPALERGVEDLDTNNELDNKEEKFNENEIDVDSYLSEDDTPSYELSYYNPNDSSNKEIPVSGGISFHQFLDNQAKNLILDEADKPIADFIIGSIDESGYVRRNIDDLIDDLAFTQNLIVEEVKVELILKKIQQLDPPGVGARSLKECLSLQLNRKDKNKKSIFNALKIIENEFELFSGKKYKKLIEKLGISDIALKESINEISKLNPKPGGSISSEVQNNTIIPDFILTLEDGNLIVEINRRNSPELKLSNSYKEMLKGYKDDPNKKKSQNEAIQFIKQKLDSAKWFIEAIEQRQKTLFVTINAIIDFQKDYFLTGEEKLLKPMILKDIAKKVDMDISTISRVANSKYIDTPYGIKLLKSYFSEGMKNIEGEDISTIEIKKILKEIIDNENKNKPLADLELSKRLIDAGYKVARRTIAKYREQMDIPVARLRKEL
ncbi:MAG TPA: RNA polymerase factor sigma-54 [Flavobacteriaceae bacterium]|jgi:RNA polymerase sigma-54 factor|nr:RNA polymerase factor sigma-54 [Flavobacteriaceae bacterium]|tara:strand:- start:2304 stop:3737 length:1434 start_codon:yes stop_codon:yes gene_type:complete